MTAIRKAISNIDAGDEALHAYTDLLNETSILEIIDSILGHQSVEEEAYFMRLEALWSLINLAYVNQREMAIICASSTQGASNMIEG